MTIEASIFETARPHLTGVAYRILGSVTDAEDAVQEAYVRWLRADSETIDNPTAWLTTVCTRICLDMLRSKKRSRIEYVGDWLPEPLLEDEGQNPERSVELASSLSMAFLLVLERLSPKERAAYLLREIFDLDYARIAETLETTESASRQLVSRAKGRIGHSHVRKTVPAETQHALLHAFQSAVQSGDVETFAQHLANDARLSVDSGGKVPAIRRALKGTDAVQDFLRRKLPVYWRGFTWRNIHVNGSLGYEVYDGADLAAVVTFGYDAENRVNEIMIVRNPDKIAARPGSQLH